MKEKMEKILDKMDKKFVERLDENRMILLGIFAGEHILILGPPGTAKSLTARAFCNLISDGVYFDYLLTRFTTPDEIFGPLSVKSLQDDKYTRITETYLPEAHIAFLDEIFKSSSAILNTLLTIINERKFHNGNSIEEVPLISLIAASNELPSDEDEHSLIALYDRFIIRLQVDNVQNEDLFKEIVVSNCADTPIDLKITIDEIKKLQSKAKLVNVPNNIWEVILSIKRQLKEQNIVISDRRWQKTISVLRISATSNDRGEINEGDILLLKFLLINDFKQTQLISQIVKRALTEGIVASSEIKKNINEFNQNNIIELKLYNPSYDEICEKKNFNISSNRKYNEVELKAFSDMLDKYSKNIESSLRYLNERRNKLEDNTTSNFWIKWINITDFLAPVDNEMNNLNNLKEEIKNIIENMKNPKPLSIKFDCPRCHKAKAIRLDDIFIEKDKKYDIECGSCGSSFQIITNNRFIPNKKKLRY